MKKHGIKILCAVLVCSFGLSLCGCGSSGESGSPSLTKSPTATPLKSPTPAPTPTAEPKINLALGKTATANCIQDDETTGGPLLPEYAVDGDDATRWSGLGPSLTDDRRVFLLDLGDVYEIGCLFILWESMDSAYKVMAAEQEEGPWHDVISQPVPDQIDLFDEIYFDKISARYVKLEMAATGYCSIYELEVYEYGVFPQPTPDPNAETLVNVAKGKNSSASAFEQETGFGADLALDGDLLTRWSPGQGTEEELFLWTVDLEQSYSIEKIRIYFESCQTDFLIETADTPDGPWKEIGRDSDVGPIVYELTPTDVSGRYVRFSRAGGGWGSFYEFEVYAKPETA